MKDTSFQPLSAREREKLKVPCRELGISMDAYPSDAALVEAITNAVLAEAAAEENPGAGFYEI